MKRKQPTFTSIHTNQKNTESAAADYYRPLIDLFELLLEWDQQEKVEGDKHAAQNK